MYIDTCFTPILYPQYHRPEGIAVIVDIFRATATIIAAFENGARSIRPVATVREAEDYKALGWPVGAERNCRRCDFADFGNSPVEIKPEMVKGKDLVFTTTNGTKAIHCAKTAARIITGGFVNLQAVADECIRAQRDVVVVCAGWEDKINIEDTLFGGALVEQLLPNGFQPAGDAAIIALMLWQKAKEDLPGFIKRTEHYKRMIDNNVEKDIPYCLTFNSSKLVPEYSQEANCLVINK
ncbi:MAG: 2-phosphosulfolactate phosphatase [Tannerella sp.]|jgi:2-phosphosulfolactate phosphatase|nr:2-phosphosulfolactate phosphatase [Tannerella sp.]